MASFLRNGKEPNAATRKIVKNRKLRTALASLAKAVSAFNLIHRSIYLTLSSSKLEEGLSDAEVDLIAAELAAAFPGHQPPDLLHPTSAVVELKHKTNKVNFRVFMILFLT